MSRGRARKGLKLGLALGGVLALTACPSPDRQELKPLSELREVESAEAPAEAKGEAPAAVVATEEAGHVECSQVYISYSVGTPCARQPTGYRSSGDDMTFGPGSSDKAPNGAWAINTDSTGAVGDVLGTGTTYGGSRGVYEVPHPLSGSTAPVPATGTKGPAKKKK